MELFDTHHEHNKIRIHIFWGFKIQISSEKISTRVHSNAIYYRSFAISPEINKNISKSIRKSLMW